MRPTLRQFEYLIAVADLGSFRAAAEHMNVSQPSLSAQIKDMEDQLQVRLIERGRRRTIPTSVGAEVVRSARTILLSVERIKHNLKENSEGLSGTIRLGVIPSIGPYLLPHVTGTLHAQYPELRIQVFDQNTLTLDEMLSEGKVDVLISTQEDHADTRHIELFQEDLWVGVSLDSALASETPTIQLKNLKNQQLLSIGAGNQISSAIQNLARLSKAFVSSQYEGSGLDATRIMAAMGAGVAILPSLYVLREATRDNDICVRRIDDARTRRTISLIWRDTSPMAPQFNVLAEIISRTAEKLLRTTG